MRYRNTQALKAPIINKVICLIELVRKQRSNVPSDIRVNEYAILRKNVGILFTYAMRQVKKTGDYAKRTLELIEEIQSTSYLICAMHGWTPKICAQIDILCDQIAEQIYAIKGSIGASARASQAKASDGEH